MKKSLIWFGALLLSTVLLLSACGNADSTTTASTDTTTTQAAESTTKPTTDETPGTPDCTHTFGEWQITVEATCASEGARKRSCQTCGEVEQEPVEKLAHTLVTDEAVSATCEVDGLTAGSHCSVCNTVLVAQEKVEKLDHTPVTDAAVSPTCSTEGLTEGSHCAVCHLALVRQEKVKKLDHTPVTDAAVSPTCSSEGLTEGSHCSVCNAVITEQLPVPKTDHTFVNGKCHCGATVSLEFVLSDDATYYIVKSIGTYQDNVVVIPDTYEGLPVKAIAGSAFHSNSKITAVYFGKNIESVGAWAFYNCTALTKVSVSDMAKWLTISFDSQYGNPLYYAKQLYEKENLITELVIPDQITAIPADAFMGCTSITKLILGKNVSTIGDRAFHSCSNLASVEWNNKLVTVGEYAFFSCRQLQSALTFPNTLTSVGKYAFSNCSSIPAITFGSALETIGEAAFQNCVKVKEITIPASTKRIGKSAFQNCTGITNAYFEKTTGWVADSYTMGESSLSYSPTAASWLTNYHCDKEWRQTE